MRRGQQVEVLKILVFGMPAQWVRGYTYVRTDPRGGYLVRISEGHLKGAEVRYPVQSVRPAEAWGTCHCGAPDSVRPGRSECLRCRLAPAPKPALRKNDAYSPFPPDANQLRVGTAMEAREHGMSRAQAEKTAREHLAEDDQYYTKIAKMEKGTPMWGWDGIFTY